LFQVETYTDEMSVVSDRVGLSLGKNIVNSPVKTCLASFGNFSLFDRPLELEEIRKIYNMDKDKYVSRLVPIIVIPKDDDEPPDEPDGPVKPPDEPEPVIDPNLLFDVNFNDSSLDVDYTKDGNPLVFEPNNINNVTLNDGFVTTTSHSTHIKLTTGLPAYLKHTGDQSWVVNFRPDTRSAIRFIVHTAPPGPDRATTLDIRTGMFMLLYNNSFQATLFKGPADDLINLSASIGSIDLDLHINSAVFTYERLNHKLSLYFNGVFLSSIIAPASVVDDVIDWSTADNIYVNQSYRFNILYPTQYHKISVYDKILTQNEIVDIYDEAQPPPPTPVVDPNLLFDVNFNDSSLYVDYTKDGNPLVFEPNNINNVTLNDGFVTTTSHSTHIKLTTGLPAYLKHTGDQSWVVNFRPDTRSDTRFIVHTAPVSWARSCNHDGYTHRNVYVFI
jgi:hypothetical protein